MRIAHQKINAMQVLGLFALVLCSGAHASSKTTFLSCAPLQKGTPDWEVILNEANGTAAVQAEKFSYTAPAAFGSETVTWKESISSGTVTNRLSRVDLSLVRVVHNDYLDKDFTDRTSCKVKRVSKKTRF